MTFLEVHTCKYLSFSNCFWYIQALVECDGDSIDLSGDVGAVGRIVISNGPAGNQEMLLDLKGVVYQFFCKPSVLSLFVKQIILPNINIFHMVHT